MENRDRWLIDGDCTLCRRQEYCSKPCTLKKRRTKAAAMKVLGEALPDGFKAALGALAGADGNAYSEIAKETEEEKVEREQKMLQELKEDTDVRSK